MRFLAQLQKAELRRHGFKRYFGSLKVLCVADLGMPQSLQLSNAERHRITLAAPLPGPKELRPGSRLQHAQPEAGPHPLLLALLLCAGLGVGVIRADGQKVSSFPEAATRRTPRVVGGTPSQAGGGD